MMGVHGTKIQWGAAAPEDRYRSVLLLPGKLLYQLDTINEIMRHVCDANPTPIGLHRWIMHRYGCKMVTARIARATLERANLLRTTAAGCVVLTLDGEAYWASKNTSIVAASFLDTFWGFAELVRLIDQSEHENGAAFQESLFECWRQAFLECYGYNRKPITDRSQFRAVLSYLVSFGLIETSDVNAELKLTHLAPIGN